MNFAKFTYEYMSFVDSYFMYIFIVLYFLIGLIALTPLVFDKEYNSYDLMGVFTRRVIIFLIVMLFGSLFAMLAMYDVEEKSKVEFYNWLKPVLLNSVIVSVLSYIVGFSLRFIFIRHILPIISSFLKSIRVQQTEEEVSDIRNETGVIAAKNYVPSEYYKEGEIFLGLDSNDSPMYIPYETWLEVNMQIIGPTRYGKGVQIGMLMEQSILNGDGAIYIDPKTDKFIQYIMYQTAMKVGKPFVYINLNDDEIGYYQPFKGGTFQEAFARFETAFGLGLSGKEGDYYKLQELALATKVLKQTRTLQGISDALDGTDASRIIAELTRWCANETLNCKSAKSFKVDKAIKDGAVVYVRGSLYDKVVLTATKVFIIEVIQSAQRLFNERQNQLTMYVDEVSFLVSQTLSRALATMLGFNVNFVLAYQSPSDLLNLDDTTLDAKAIAQSIDVNTQLKVVYGGKDFELAEWIANLSGTIAKSVTRLERTNVGALGGETWDDGRMVGDMEENLITTNTVLSLPPRVNILIRPMELAMMNYTCFVPVEDKEPLDNYVRDRMPKIDVTSSDVPTNDADSQKPKKKDAKKTTNKSHKTTSEKDDISPDKEIVQTSIASPVLANLSDENELVQEDKPVIEDDLTEDNNEQNLLDMLAGDDDEEEED